MKVIILCGGQGTRLREETEFRPKPMLEIGNDPILFHIMKRYISYRFRDFILPLGYRGNVIRDYFLNLRNTYGDTKISFSEERGDIISNYSILPEFDITLVDTGIDTQTAGRIRKVSRYILEDDSDKFMVTYGDGVADIDLIELLDYHNRHGKLATITVGKSVSRFGIVEFDYDGRINKFSEKPENGWTNIGFMIFNKSVLDYIDYDSDKIEDELIQQLIRIDQVRAYQHNGFFHQMDTYRDYLHLNQMWNDGTTPWRTICQRN